MKKNILIVALLITTIIGFYFAYSQNKNAVLHSELAESNMEMAMEARDRADMEAARSRVAEADAIHTMMKLQKANDALQKCK